MYYVNYNRHGQGARANSLKPYNIQVDGSSVSFDGVMSSKTKDIINEENLVSHHITGETPHRLYCVSEEAAERAAQLLRENPNYGRR